MTETNNNHVAEQIEAYLDEELSPAERIAFDAHIAGCEPCRALLDESRQTRAELRSLFASAHPSGSFEDRLIEGFRMGTSRRLHWVQPSVRRAAFAAAAAVLLVGAGITVSQSLDAENRRTVMANDLRQIGEAMQMYRNDFGGAATNAHIAALPGPVDSKKIATDYDGDGVADSKRTTGQAVAGLDDASRAMIARQGEIRYQVSSNLDQARQAIAQRNWAEAQTATERARLAANTDPTIFSSDDMRRFSGQADQAELDLHAAQEAYLASAQPEQAKAIDLKIQEDRKQADLQRQRTIADLVRTSQSLANQGKYREALQTDEQILVLEPNNGYATGIHPLLEDKVQLQTGRHFEEMKRRKIGQQFAKAEDGRVSYDDILRYPTDWPDLSKMADQKGAKKPSEQAVAGLDVRSPGSQISGERIAGGKDKPYFATNGRDGTSVLISSGPDRVYGGRDDIVVGPTTPDAQQRLADYQSKMQSDVDTITQTATQKLKEAQDANTQLTNQLQAANKNVRGDVAGNESVVTLQDANKGSEPDRYKFQGDSQHAADAQAKPDESTPTTQAAILGRKIIRNANMQFEVDRFDDAQLRVTKLAAEQGGFVAGTDSDKLPNGKMRGTMTLRVPPEHLETLVLELRGIGDLKSQKIGAEDVTRHYTDLESSLRAAHAMQDRLLEIIKSGKGQIKDLLEAEKQLGVWREKSEQIEGEKRYLDNLVSLSTLTLEMAERDIRQAAVATESEQVAMSLETEAVDKAYAKARAVIEAAKGRILQSEMKQLDAGQFGATIRAAIPPDVAEQVIAGLRQLDGRIAHFSRESHRTTQEGEASVATANTVRHDDTIVALQIYNLANIAPRRTTNIVIAIADVEKAYQKLLADVQSAGGRVLTSSLTRPDGNQQTGEIQVQLPTEKADALELAASSLGETMRHESTENPDGANVTDAKRGFHFIVVSSTTIAARETRQIGLVATTVSVAFESIRQAVVDAGGRITQSESNDQGTDGQTGVLSFDVPRANLQTITGAIDKSAVLLSQNASRSPDTQNTIDSKLRFSLTISSAQKLAPRQTVSLGSEVSDVNAAVAALTTAVDAAGGRRIDTGGVSQDPTTTTAEVIVEVPADRAQAIIQQIEQSGRTFNKRVAFDPNAPQGTLSRARIQATFSDSAKNLGGQESGWDAMRRGLETSAAGLRWSLQMLVIGACFVAPWIFVIWIGWKLLRRKPRKTVPAVTG